MEGRRLVDLIEMVDVNLFHMVRGMVLLLGRATRGIDTDDQIRPMRRMVHLRHHGTRLPLAPPALGWGCHHRLLRHIIKMVGHREAIQGMAMAGGLLLRHHPVRITVMVGPLRTDTVVNIEMGGVTDKMGCCERVYI